MAGSPPEGCWGSAWAGGREPLLAPGLGPAGDSDSVLARCLLPASILYGRAALLRRRWSSARASRLDCPVISVGNITCGGTGKTPTVEMVARDLIEIGRKPAILSRGYRASRISLREGPHTPEMAAPGAGNDEFRVLRENLPHVPHYQGRDRSASGREAIARGADVLILDDGFQHTRLHRDLDMVLIDAIFPFGGGRVLPSGLLREPLDVLSRADLFGITRADLVSSLYLSRLEAYLRNRFPRIPRVLLRAEPLECRTLSGRSEDVALLRGRRVLAFSGIGNPESFRRQLAALGAVVEEHIPFRDHHEYSQGDLARLRARAAAIGVEGVIMTQKDSVKTLARDQAPADWMYLRIAQRVLRGIEEYRGALERLFS